MKHYLSTLHKSQQRIISQRRETNIISFKFSPDYCPAGVFRLQSKEEKRSLIEFESQILEFRKGSEMNCSVQRTREEGTTNKVLGI